MLYSRSSRVEFLVGTSLVGTSLTLNLSNKVVGGEQETSASFFLLVQFFIAVSKIK